MIHLRTLAILLTLTFAISAQSVQPTLTINGHVDASIPINRTMVVEVNGTPGTLAFVAFNLNPGPSTVLGMSIPIAIAGAQISHNGVVIPPSGVFNGPIFIPDVPALSNITAYAFCLTADPGLPMGFGFSNGASVTFTPTPAAGSDTAGKIGERATLDGGGSLNAGPLPLGMLFSWSVLNGPTGHSATIDGPDTAFPGLVADIPGLYTLELSILAAGTTGGSADTVDVNVYDIDTTSHVQGQFDTGTSHTVTADLLGPPATLFEITGISQASGTTVSANVPATTPATSVQFLAASPTGQIVGEGLSIVNNAGAAFGAPPLDTVVAHLKQPFLDNIETVLEATFATVNLGGTITGLPPINVVNLPGPFGITLFSADVTLTGLTYDPTIDIELTANTNGLNVQVIVTNMEMTFDISGLILGASYLDTGILTIPTATISFDTLTTVTGGVYATTTANESATLSGASLTFTQGVIPANFASTLLGSFVPVIETTMATTFATALPPVIDTTFNSVPQAIDLSVTNGIDVTVDLLPAGIDYYAGAMSLRLDGGAHANNVDPNAAVLPLFFSTPNAPPTYGVNVPGTTLPYDIALSMGDDFFNQLAAATIRAGGLEVVLSEPVTILGQSLLSNAGTMSQLFPGVGFEKFNPLANASIHVHPTVSPIASVGAVSGELLSFSALDVEIDIRVDVTPTYQASVLRFGLLAEAGVDIVLDPVALTFDIVPGTITGNAYPIGSMPGVDPTPTLSGVSALLGSIVQGLLGGLSGIPLPDPTGLGLTFGTTVVGITADGPAGDYISIFLN